MSNKIIIELTEVEASLLARAAATVFVHPSAVDGCFKPLERKAAAAAYEKLYQARIRKAPALVVIQKRKLKRLIAAMAPMVDYYRSLTGGEDDPELVRELGQLDEALREVWEP